MSAAQAASYPWHRHRPALGTDEQFAALRCLLEESDYSEAGLCRRLKVENLDQYSTTTAEPRPVEQPIDALIRLFFDCLFLDEADMARVLAPEVIALLDGLNLVVRDAAYPGKVYASAAILPASGIVTVCDRGAGAPDGSRTELPPDVVYPAIFDTTKMFLNGLPASRCEAMLDLGTGTGIAALLRAPYSGHVWASDITERSAYFAEFNRRMAAVGNMTVVLGDMYEPVKGLTFDRIVTHPPYVPENRTSKLVFRDAGQDGEQIIRRAIEGVPEVLRPGGRFYSLQMATDREGEKLEDRVRKWLGDASNEFDVVVLVHSSRSVHQYLGESAVQQPVNLEKTRDLVEMWQQNKTTALVYAAILLERHETPRAPITVRAQAGTKFSGAHLEWLLDWHKAVMAPGSAQMLLESKPLLSPQCTMNVLNKVQDGRFRMAEITIHSESPFRSFFRCEPWLAQVVSDCDGNRSWREHFEEAKRTGMAPPAVPIGEFAELLGRLVASGILRIQ